MDALTRPSVANGASRTLSHYLPRMPEPATATEPTRVPSPPPDVVATTRLAAPAEEVWARAVTPEGINDELRPILRMTMPRAYRGKTIDDVKVGEPLGRSWIYLFRVLPVDYDNLTLAGLEPGRRFRERSTMLSMTLWQHEREVVPVGEAECEVTDRLTFTLRPPMAWIPGMKRLAIATVRHLFAHRHRRLAERYGSSAVSTTL
jgi:ligand-binding SRPBCC domain-containing protein